MSTPFHLAFPVKDIEATRNFFGDLLDCEIGRSTDRWIDFNFFGHHLSAHLTADELKNTQTNDVDGKKVPISHFGAILEGQQWHDLANKLKSHGVEFIIEPHIRYEGEVYEQATMFFLDPSGNALEFKAFKDQSQLFAK